MEFNKNNPEDYENLLDDIYAVRYQSAENILKAYDVPLKVSELRIIFHLIKDVKDNEADIKKVKIAHFLAREKLMNAIKNFFNPPSLENLNRAQLNELLLDECFLHNPNLSRIKELVDAGADIYSLDDWGWTAFQRAIHRFKQRDLVEFFIAKGIDVNYPFPPYQNAPQNYHFTLWLQSLTVNCKEDMLYLLIKNGANILDKDSSGNTVLHLSASSQTIKKGLFKYFVEQGVDVNAKNNDGNTVLMKMNESSYAHRDKNLSIMKYILSVGADPNIKNNQLKTVLEVSMVYNATDDLVIRLLHKFGADIDELTSTNQTLLMLATELNYLIWAKTLIELGANQNIRDKKGQTAYEFAISKGFLEIARLINAEADSDYCSRPEYVLIQETKNLILSALQKGKRWRSYDKESWREFYFNGHTFFLHHGEHGSDNNFTNEYSSDDALKYLYRNVGYFEKIKTELEIWQSVLNSLA